MHRELGSFSFDVARRLLKVLDENSDVKKTNLATSAGLNYNVCIRYIEMLNILQWVEVNSAVNITPLGRRVYSRLLEQDDRIDNAHSGISRDHLQRKNVLANSEVKGEKNAPHVMIVDDEPDVALTYAGFLSSIHYSVATFNDPYQALRQFVSDPAKYDLVILDIRMENMNGLQLYQSLRAINGKLKVIFVSALDAAKELVTIIPEVGNDAVIRKPVSKDDFIKAIKKALAKK
jgi:CheY-like chemotaxis protein/predicted transcriptional regulator